MARYITLAAAGEQCGVSPRTIRRWIAEGLLTGYRLGRRSLRVDADELEALHQPIPNAATRESA